MHHFLTTRSLVVGIEDVRTFTNHFIPRFPSNVKQITIRAISVSYADALPPRLRIFPAVTHWHALRQFSNAASNVKIGRLNLTLDWHPANLWHSGNLLPWSPLEAALELSHVDSLAVSVFTEETDIPGTTQEEKKRGERGYGPLGRGQHVESCANHSQRSSAFEGQRIA